MKYLIFLALVVHALAGPADKPDKRPEGPGGPGGPGGREGPGGPGGSLGPKPSGPPPIGSDQPFDYDHHNVTGLPPHDNSSRPPHPEGFNGHPRYRRQAPDAFHSAPPKTDNPPQSNGFKPAGGPPPSGKPPAEPISQAKPGQGPKPRPKRHLKGNENRPTGAPHGDHTRSAHTHESGASRPTHAANHHGGGKPGGHKG